MDDDKKRQTDDSESFLNAVRDVKRLKHNVAETHRNPRNRQAPIPIAPPQLEASEDGFFARDGVQKTVLVKLRKGHIPIEEELDLHGYPSKEAESALRAFLAKARLAGHRAVRVIHGKGLGSPDGNSVLKTKTQEWLRQSEAVLAFCRAGPASGGSGAVHVLLRKR